MGIRSRFVFHLILCLVTPGLLLPWPVLADPAHLLSKSEERKIGSKVVEEVKREFRMLDDPYLMEYLDRIGHRLSSARAPAETDMGFHVVADSRINAFAVPGGHIFVTSQTILICGDESELAGVIAHEMGHVEGRHIANRMESVTKLNLGTLAAILAGAFLTGSPQAGAAIATFAMAGAQTKMLQYSRTDEEDADRRGTRTLLAAGYDGWGLVRFMEDIRRQSPSPEGIPAYLFTHPLPENRAVYLAQMLPPGGPFQPTPATLGPLWRAQARVLAQDPRPWGFAMVEKRAEEHPESADAKLGLALLLKVQGRYDEALEQLDAAQKLVPGDPEIAHERAAVWLRQGRRDEAVALLEDMRTEGTATMPALGELAWAYLEADQGQKALDVCDDLAKRAEKGRKLAKADYYRGLALGKVGREGEGQTALGDYYRDQGEPEQAGRHYREALRHLPNGPLRERVERSVGDVGRRAD